MNHLLASAATPPSSPMVPPVALSGDMEEMEQVLAQALASPTPAVTPILDRLAHYRGKRLRPLLLLLTARACGKVQPAHYLLGAVVEMIHTATLVHDDVLDGATARRHVPTVNASWGNQTSVLLGDYLFTHAFHLTSTLDDVRACRIIGEATNRVCAGEMQQVCERGRLTLSEDDYFAIIDAKTAELTSCCCRLGAMFSDATTEVVAGMARFGRHLGVAFQIADDLLDLVGQEQRTGKSLGTDVEQQKLTLPLIHLLATAPGAAAAEVRRILRSGQPHKREALLPLLHDSDALTYAHGRALEQARQARMALRCLAPSEYRDFLEYLTERAVVRES
jgi:octaprenyl-diphosphate synthase